MATAHPDGEPREQGFWQRAKERLSGGQQARDVADRKAEVAGAGAREIAVHGDRDICTLHGTLRQVTVRPHGGVAALEAELYDDSGSVTLIWLGRRRIAGIACGRELTVHGRLGCSDGQRRLFNPRYELSP